MHERHDIYHNLHDFKRDVQIYLKYRGQAK